MNILSMNIHIKTIPHKQQRYETCGDYWDTKKGEEFRISKMLDKKYEMLVAIHELIEKFLADCKGIKEPDTTAFDMNFEKERKLGLHDIDEEPGFDPFCPVFRQHAISTKIERMLAREIGVNWAEYDSIVNSL